MRRVTQTGTTGALVVLLILGVVAALGGSGRSVVAAGPIGAQGVTRPYDPGNPTLVDLYVNPVVGSDDNPGTLPEQPVRSLRVAWQRIIEFAVPNVGYRFNLQPGTYRFDPVNRNKFGFLAGMREGTFQHPIIFRAELGPGTVNISGGLEFERLKYLYLEDLKLSLLDQDASIGNSLLRIADCDHVLVRNVEVNGPNPALPDAKERAEDAVRVERSQYVYLENNDIHGAVSTGVRLFAVQRGHLLANRVHEIGGWAVQLHGGSAYLRAERNELYYSGQGFLAGGDSNFELMRSPWLHYDAYDVKFVNNIVHDVPGIGAGAAGGFNVLLAYNTFHRIGTYQDGQTPQGYPLMAFWHGRRFCAEAAENGTGNATANCAAHLAAGGWGTTDPAAREPIPNRRVSVYNNVFYNPSPLRTRGGHLYVEGAVAPTPGSNIPAGLHADTSLAIVGNVIWNGPQNTPLGLETAGSGCAHATCNAAQIRRDNRINTLQPQFRNPAQGDLRPRPNGNLVGIRTVQIPAFAFGHEAPVQPPVPVGDNDNTVPEDYAGEARGLFTPGAYAGAYVPSYGVSGTILGPFGYLPGVKLTFQVVEGSAPAPAPAVTNQAGAWSRANIQPFVTYRVTPSLTGYKFTPASLEFSSERTDLDFSAEVDGYTIFGFAGDRLANAVNGVTVTFVPIGRRGRSVPKPAKSDATGLFSAAGFQKGVKYRAVAGLPGWKFKPSSIVFKKPNKLLYFTGRRIR